MFVAVWLCVLALALPCWTYPSGHITTCEEFGRGVSFDPVNAVGEWFAVYSFVDYNITYTERINIRELTSSQLEQFDHMLRGYSKEKLKFHVKSRVLLQVVIEMDSILVPQDDDGNVDAWITRIQSGSTDVPVPNNGPHRMKWKSVDGFLVMMACSSQRVMVMSKTTTPDEDKLQRAVDSLDIEGFTGRRVYYSLLTLL